MQFNILAIAAIFASVAAATETVTVYACSSTAAASTSAAVTSGVAKSTIASTGVVTAPTSTGSPISYASTGAGANMKAGSALGLFALGGVALLI